MGGSRRIGRLNAEVCARIDNIISKGLTVLVGDANGADKAAQSYMSRKGYANVEVFAAGDKCRNNLGNWPVRKVRASKRDGLFRFYTAKDKSMAREADVGFMIWDGSSAGTLLNAGRLIRESKKVVIYEGPKRRFMELRTHADWTSLLARSSTEVRQKVERELSFESEGPPPVQRGLPLQG
jgi:hypothetical protein